MQLGPNGSLGLVVALSAVLGFASGCDRTSDDARTAEGSIDNAEVTAAVLSADDRYADAWLKHDWAGAASLIAPGYYGISTDFEIDRAGLKELFQKVNAHGYEKQSPHVRVLKHDLAMVSYEMVMKESYEGRDISGRYWYATTWLLTADGWKLLIEEEIPLGAPVSLSN